MSPNKQTVERYLDGFRTHDRDQIRVADDAEMQGYLRRWRALLAAPPEVETYRVDPGRDGAAG